MGVGESTSGRKIRKKEDSYVYRIETERDGIKRREGGEKNGMMLKVL